MNSVRLIVLGVALLAGVACVALLARGMAASKEHPPVVVPVAAQPTVRVLVAKRDLNVGEHVGEADMNWQAWPAENLNPLYITDGGVKIAPAQPSIALQANQAVDAAKTAMSNPAQGAGASIVGAIVRERIAAGEPFITSKLVRPGTAGVMAVTLDPGYRAMALPLSAESAAGGFILPGDHVDVVLSRQIDGVAAGAGSVSATGSKIFAANTVLKNVRVLAIDQNTGVQKGDAVIGATATVEVSPDQARTLVVAKAAGQLTFVLRSYADAQGPPVSGDDPQGHQNNGDVVRVFRPGSSTTVMVNR